MILPHTSLLLGGALLLGTASLLPVHADDLPSADKPGWTLTFEDTFPGPALDAAKWNAGYPHHDVINHELQAYVPTAFAFDGNGLGIVAKKEQATYGHGQTMEYTSGAITTFKKFSQQYGWFEARCRMLKGKGYWPAFWLLPLQGWPPEIDIFESLGHEPHSVHCTNHWKNEAGHPAGQGFEYKSPADLTEDFHVYAIDWEPGSIVWYVDGKKVAECTKGVAAEPMYILFNLAIGGDWPGGPNADTVFPATFAVSYVRVYSKDGGYAATADPAAAPAPAVN